MKKLQIRSTVFRGILLNESIYKTIAFLSAVAGQNLLTIIKLRDETLFDRSYADAVSSDHDCDDELRRNFTINLG